MTVEVAAPAAEAWTHRGGEILDPDGCVRATVSDPSDARRIVAAINAVAGIPTDALESWVGFGGPADLASFEGVSEIPEELRGEAVDAIDRFLDDRRLCSDRRLSDRRQGDRRRRSDGFGSGAA